VTTPLEDAKRKIAGQEAAFIEACAGYWRWKGKRRSDARGTVKFRFKLSWQFLELLEIHFRLRIGAWPNLPAPLSPAAIDRTLPTGDRE